MHAPLRQKSGASSGNCTARRDDDGLLNSLKAWYIYFLHVASCALFIVVMLVLVDGSDFSTGSRSEYSTKPHITRFFQTEVNGLVSVALMLIRLLAGAAASLVAWRWAFVILERSGITLAELVRLVDLRLPYLPRFESSKQLSWSIMTVLVMILSWPPSFSAPLANSSLAWIPSGRLAGRLQNFDIASMNGQAKWADIIGRAGEQQWRAFNMMQTNSMAAMDPAYAYKSTALPLQRIFAINEPVPLGSKADIMMPYFDVLGIRWINGAVGFPKIGRFTADTITTSISGMVTNNRANGSVTLYRSVPFDIRAATVPPKPEVYNGTQLVYVRVAQLESSQGYSKDSPCPKTSPWLGLLPNVTQNEVKFFENSTTFEGFRGKDCYVVGEVKLLAGQYGARACNITYSAARQNTATCFFDRRNARPSPDTRTNYTIESMSETMRNMMPLKVADEYMGLGLNAYTTGMLRVAYHASWSSTTEFLSRSKEQAHINIMEPVVRASVNRSRMYIWMGMNLCLLISAALVSVTHVWTSTKTIRDTALAALTMDLTDVCHQGRAPGLCNAVALNSKDKLLPRLMWQNTGRSTGNDWDSENDVKGSCERKVMFVGEGRGR